jgi:hypothetical protein
MAQSAKRLSFAIRTTTNGNSAPTAVSTSPCLLPRTGPRADKRNRRDFENNPGEKAGKSLLRSKPSGAEIFDSRLVGRTRLSMVVAPGKYHIHPEESGTALLE